MNYDPDAPPVRSIDVASTKTPNHGRYRDSNALLLLNGQGRPVAIRPVRGMGQPGSFTQRHYQVIRPSGIVALSRSALLAWIREKAYPVN